MTLCLSDPEEYKGGDMEFAFHDKDGDKQPKICEEIRPKGSLIVFPSFVWHRVKPVTKGIRNSLVCWNLGEPFV
jgi:PKHD-type hydroxylase